MLLPTPQQWIALLYTMGVMEGQMCWIPRVSYIAGFYLAVSQIVNICAGGLLMQISSTAARRGDYRNDQEAL